MQTPFSEKCAILIAAQSHDDKTRKRLVKKWGYPPEELKIGQWAEYFKQTPKQLGFSEKNDYALLSRSMEAVNIFRIAQRATKDLSSISPQEAAVIMDLQIALKKKR